MIAVLEQKRAELAETCRRFGVARLEVFGSASEGTFEPGRSDIDLLVEFLPGTDLGPWLRGYFQLKQQLELLFGHEVDLVMAGAVRAERFVREVNRTRRLLYAA